MQLRNPLKIQLYGRLSVLQLFHVGHVERNGQLHIIIFIIAIVPIIIIIIIVIITILIELSDLIFIIIIIIILAA